MRRRAEDSQRLKVGRAVPIAPLGGRWQDATDSTADWENNPIVQKQSDSAEFGTLRLVGDDTAAVRCLIVLSIFLNLGSD